MPDTVETNASSDTASYVSFRPGSLRKDLESRARRDQISISLVARRDLERYYALMKNAIPKFSLPEALLIVDSSNSVYFGNIPATCNFIWMKVADSIKIDGLDEKWDVDGESLVNRLSKLSLAENLAIADAAERWWGLVNTDDFDDHEKGLKDVGLIVMTREEAFAFSGNLKKMLFDNKASSEDLSKNTSISVDRIEQLVSGEAVPTETELVLLSRAFGCDTDRIFLDPE